MCRAQVRVAAGACPHRYAQQARQVARDARADTARRVVDDEHLPDASAGHTHSVTVAAPSEPTHATASSGRTTG